MNKLKSWLLKSTTMLSLCVAFGIMSMCCRTWLYQPPVPAKLLAMDE